jgi:hypothetical protein
MLPFEIREKLRVADRMFEACTGLACDLTATNVLVAGATSLEEFHRLYRRVRRLLFFYYYVHRAKNFELLLRKEMVTYRRASHQTEHAVKASNEADRNMRRTRPSATDQLRSKVRSQGTPAGAGIGDHGEDEDRLPEHIRFGSRASTIWFKRRFRVRLVEQAPLAKLQALLQDYLLHTVQWKTKVAHRARCVRERLLRLLRESVLVENEWEVVEVVLNGEPMTAEEIARKIGRGRGTSFDKMLAGLVRRGVLRTEKGGGYLYDHSFDYFNSR